MKNSEIIDIIEKNLTNYINKGGIIKYPFPVADFAIRNDKYKKIYYKY